MNSAPIPSEARPRLSSRARLQTDRVTGKPVLLYPEGALFLNPTGYSIVQLCQGESTCEQMVAALAIRYQVPAQQISTEVSAFLDRLRTLNLLDLQVPSGSKP
jgi:coenzyme PQQ biosynthesis protein PqqD